MKKVMELEKSEKQIIILAFGKLISEARNEIKDVQDGKSFCNSASSLSRWIEKLESLESKLIKESK